MESARSSKDSGTSANPVGRYREASGLSMRPHPTRQTLTLDGVDISVEMAGDGPAVLCLHAVGHDGRDYEALVDRLGQSYRFVCVDWPGQGGSSGDHQPASAKRYAELAEGVMQRLDLQRPILIGNSIGGAAAIHIASRRPVQALVLCDSGGLLAVTPAVTRFCGLFERFFRAGERGAWWYGPLFALYYRLVLPAKAARPQRARIVAGARRSAGPLRQAWASFAMPDADIRDIAATLDVPIWVAWARNDRTLPLSRCLPAIRRLKFYRLSTFPGGHCPFLEQPDAFAEEFLSFMNRLPR
jgi:pimeloyl-ACP methyl ester carboxylesterase